jgi:hypothetical protein
VTRVVEDFVMKEGQNDNPWEQEEKEILREEINRFHQTRKDAKARAAQVLYEELVGEEEEEEVQERMKSRITELTGNVGTPPMTTKEDQAEAMWNILGYTIMETGSVELDKEILAIHKQRLRDILGGETRVNADLQEQGQAGGIQDKSSPDPSGWERFRNRPHKRLVRTPEEMRDMAEESVGRVKTRED